MIVFAAKTLSQYEMQIIDKDIPKSLGYNNHGATRARLSIQESQMLHYSPSF